VRKTKLRTVTVPAAGPSDTARWQLSPLPLVNPPLGD
jgi:hypothetical protein